MAGTLYVVGTPIGNLKDITYRAVETLSSVDVIACEDTRVSLKLLSYYNVKKPLISYYKQKEREGSEKIISLLSDGKNVALITMRVCRVSAIRARYSCRNVGKRG